jgi:UDP-2-acetamido-3-amino-2,3-dideoxy-glucuronate N-acetyltransferase
MNQLNSTDPQIAVIGSGYWGKNLVRNYHQLGALKLICDKNEIVLEYFQKQYPGVETCLSYNDVLSRKNIVGVVIATPAETHFRLAREALLAGKHVYVEKPLVLDEAEGEELIAFAKERGLVLMVGHLLQYHPVFVYLKKIVRQGELGRINYIYSNRLNLGKIRREENILWSFAPHDISMILSLAGEEPENISSIGGNYLHQKIADVTTTHMSFPSGMQAHIFVSWLHPFKEQKLVVVGDKKMAVFDDTQPWEEKLLLYPHKIKWQNNLPVADKGDAERPKIDSDEPLKIECQQFLTCISDGCSPMTDGREGLRVLRVLNASQLSLDNNGSSVRFRDSGEMELSQIKPAQNSTAKKGSPPFKGETTDFFMHATAVLDENCNIGKGTKIWHFSHVLNNSILGENCNIGQNVVIGPDVSIGNNCKIQNNVSVYTGVTLEEGVFCGPSMVFTNINNPRAEISKMDQVKPTLVKRGASMGANSTIICGTTLGKYSFVGAGAVVTKNIPDYALVAGNPAKQIGWVCMCGERLTDGLECLVCGNNYLKEKGTIVLKVEQ